MQIFESYCLSLRNNDTNNSLCKTCVHNFFKILQYVSLKKRNRVTLSSYVCELWSLIWIRRDCGSNSSVSVWLAYRMLIGKQRPTTVLCTLLLIKRFDKNFELVSVMFSWSHLLDTASIDLFLLCLRKCCLWKCLKTSNLLQRQIHRANPLSILSMVSCECGRSCGLSFVHVISKVLWLRAALNCACTLTFFQFSLMWVFKILLIQKKPWDSFYFNSSVSLWKCSFESCNLLFVQFNWTSLIASQYSH